jgi:PilX N-terminal
MLPQRCILASERGIVLVASLLILALLMAGGLGAIFSTQTDLKSSANLKTGKQAFYIADAGLSRAWQQLDDGNGINDFAMLIHSAGPVTLVDNEAFAGGSHTVIAELLPGPGPRRLRVISNGCQSAGNPCPSGSSKSVLEAHLRRESLFPGAITTTASVILSTGARTDSYDSRLGPYASNAASSAGHVRSNGSIILSGSTTVLHGDAYAGSQVLISNGASVGGVVTEGGAARDISPIVPCGPPYHDGSGIAGGSYNPLTGELRGAGTDAIILPDGSYCFSSVDLSDASSLTVNGPVRIRLTSHSNLTGGGLINTTEKAENLMIFSSVASATLGVSIAGGSSTYVTVYAPRAKIMAVGPGDLFGALVGENVTNSGAVSFHYDQKLMDNEDGNVTFVLWKEVF